MNCRKGCGACCIAISISSPLPNHPNGKPAGVRCKNLTEYFTCSLWLDPITMPKICKSFQADIELCGNSYLEAVNLINKWEELTR
jgi:uncharacterized protein